jgi:hypothetical protein
MAKKSLGLLEFALPVQFPGPLQPSRHAAHATILGL